MTAVIGHRGARGHAPENTLAGIARGVALGADAIEIDVVLSADGVPVVHHDLALNPDIARIAGAWVDHRTPIGAMTGADLARIDVGRLAPGSATADAFPDQTPQDGAGIPTLRDVLTATDIPLLIELKSLGAAALCPPDPRRLADAAVVEARAANALERVVWQSFDWRALRHLRARDAALALAWLSETSVSMDVLRAEGVRRWSPDHRALTMAQVRAVRAEGIAVVPWTVNETADIARLAGWEVDGIITDYPDRAVSIVRAAGRR